MAFARSETAHTMLSRTHSARDLMRGLSHVLEDSLKNLPEDLDSLQELTYHIGFSCHLLFLKDFSVL